MYYDSLIQVYLHPSTPLPLTAIQVYKLPKALEWSKWRFLGPQSMFTATVPSQSEIGWIKCRRNFGSFSFIKKNKSRQSKKVKKKIELRKISSKSTNSAHMEHDVK